VTDLGVDVVADVAGISGAPVKELSCNPNPNPTASSWTLTPRSGTKSGFSAAVEGPEAGGSEMSDDEVEEIGQSMTANDELRLFGMRGDDEEDLLVSIFYFLFVL
jgi:hypothetical protein